MIGGAGASTSPHQARHEDRLGNPWWPEMPRPFTAVDHQRAGTVTRNAEWMAS
jgi:hypothetical protein